MEKLDKKDSTKQCMKPDDNPQNIIYDDVSTDELCTIMMAKKANVFDEKSYIKDLTEVDKNILNFGQTTKSKKLCKIENGKAYDNCAIIFNNPYITTHEYTDKKNKSSDFYCSLMKGIYKEHSDDIVSKDSEYYVIYQDTKNPDDPKLILPSTQIYESKVPKHFCDERWQDRFCIPNYHLGNKWHNQVADKDKGTQTVGVCYQPCPIGFRPAPETAIFARTPTGIENCIKYNDAFSYLPIMLVCLLGTTFDEFKDENYGYIAYLNEYKTQINDTKDMFLINDTKISIYDALIEVLKKEEQTNIVWNDIKADISNNVKNIFIAYTVNDKFVELMYKNPKFYTGITDPQIQKLYPYAYKIAYNINDMLSSTNTDTYKQWRERLKTVTGLDESKFVYMLKMLKNACNICFDGKTYAKYSKDEVLHYLNQTKIEGIEIKELQLDIHNDPVDKPEEPLKPILFKKNSNIGVYDHIDDIKQTYVSIMDTLWNIFYFVNIAFIIYLLCIKYYEFVTHYCVNVPYTGLYYVWIILVYTFWFIVYYFLYLTNLYRNGYVTYVNEITLKALKHKRDSIISILNSI
jgi:hypothetical protein